MKRTAEMILTIIGIILNLLFIAGTVLLVNLFKDPAMRSELEAQLRNDPQLASAGVDLAMMVDVISGVGWWVIAVVVISTILSLIAAFALRGNRKPKLAGGLLIASALIIGLGTILSGWLPALLFLIAGILCFARKERVAA
ncbi:DUF4064 domain-containing protein [Bacillus thermotolerans]|uniref:DUF4064 domain-containing protein n=1 Tax=Bacillus thermotolerans TaxID=1221996 RepID=A0A0F5HYZ4_BACTR|nr:DUF4064 domain-containing protein [Bacillus thermotolerans]KKB38270.1 hypothetical protein QY97_02803 [Bacillus thermotolerans]KKB39816.1 hypothetical protein QY95_02033 [Bacillus thermotolerans]KKB44254.1 hypothetical protein QY96_03276 [Bacillus thermotolerans]